MNIQQGTVKNKALAPKHSLHEFSRMLVFEPTLDQYKKQALAQFPEHFINHPTSFMLSFEDIMKYKTQTFIKFNQHYQKFRPDPNVFKVMGTSETTSAFSLTNLLCFPAIEYLGSPKQFQHYSNLIEDGRIVAAYAQTEIGHGSDVQKLATQATFDPVKKCFIFHSPSSLSIKFWPGALGIFATHIITQAQLVVNGKHYGLQTFIVQIRDIKTFKNLKGVVAGDLGPKLGFKAVDNGYLIFDHLEVPLEALLSKFIQIDENGNVTKEKDKNVDKLAYGAMMTLRANMLRHFAEVVYKNHQMGNLHKKLNGKNPYQLRRDLDNLSQYFSFILCAKHTRNLLQEFLNYYHNSNQEEALKMIAEIHFLTTGFKTLSSWAVIKSSREEATSVGLGNLLVTGMVQQYADGVPTSTYEGDNVVLMLQVIRCVLGSFTSLMGGNTLTGSMEFLNKYQTYAVEQREFEEVIQIKNKEDLLLYADDIIDNFVFKLIQRTGKKIQDAMMNEGIPMKRIMSEELQTELVNTAIKIFHVVNHKLAIEVFRSEMTSTFLRDKDKALLGKLLELQKLNYLQEKLNSLLETRVVNFHENIGNLIHSVKELYYADLIPEVDYLFSQGLVTQKELSTMTDFKDITHQNYTKNFELIKEVCKDVQSNLNKLSKL